MNSLYPWLNRARRRPLRGWRFHIVFGERSQGRLLALADHVDISPFNFIKASGGIQIEEGAQIAHHVSIVTHRAQSLLGRQFASWPTRVVGDSRRSDEKLLARHPELREHYDAWVQRPGTEV